MHGRARTQSKRTETDGASATEAGRAAGLSARGGIVHAEAVAHELLCEALSLAVKGLVARASPGRTRCAWPGRNDVIGLARCVYRDPRYIFSYFMFSFL